MTKASHSDRRRRRTIKVVFAALVIAIAATLCIQVVWTVLPVRHRLHELQERGQPLTLEQWERQHTPTRVERQSAMLYYEAFALLRDRSHRHPRTFDYNDVVMLDASLPISPAMRDAAEAYLDAHRGSLRLLHEASQRGPAALQITFDDAGTPHVPDRTLAMRGFWLLSLEAVLAAERGDDSAAGDALLAMTALLRFTSTDLTMESFPTRERMIGVMTASIARTLALRGGGKFDAATRADITERLAEIDSRDALVDILIYERVVTLKQVAAKLQLPSVDKLASRSMADAGEIDQILDYFESLIEVARSAPDEELATRFRQIISEDAMPLWTPADFFSVSCQLRLARGAILGARPETTLPCDPHTGGAYIVERTSDYWSIQCPADPSRSLTIDRKANRLNHGECSTID